MSAVLTIAAAVGLGAVGAVVPWVCTEAALVSAVILLPPRLVPVLVLGVALAQVAGKGALYGVARWAPRAVPQKARERLERLSARCRRRGPSGLVLASSSLGIPPFYAVTLACGTLAVPLARFLAAALAGSLIRYAAFALATELARGVV
jgi:membrane protein YqaA with SNARE-associated domain